MMDGSVDFDPYEVLQVPYDADKSTLVKAFRKMALKWHPDKNADKIELAEKMFLTISKALEMLSDEKARAALDRLRKAKEAKAVRFEQLDAKRRKMREDLEQREAQASGGSADEVKARNMLRKEMDRLRKEGCELLKQERERLNQQMHAATSTAHYVEDESDCKRIRVKWTKTTDGFSYDQTELTRLFSQWGDVRMVLIGKKGTTAIIEFANTTQAETAMRMEVGVPSMPLTVTKLSNNQSQKATPTSSNHDRETSSPFQAANQQPAATHKSDDTNLESEIFKRMREANERRMAVAKQTTDNDDRQS